MTKCPNVELVPLSFWAVGRLADAQQIAIKLNDSAPILMDVQVAREIATALRSESDAASKLRPSGAAARSKPSSKR